MQQSIKKNDLSRGQRFWRALVKLDFISKFFTWTMELLARVTEPLASLSAIYIIICAGVPALLSIQLYTLALALIIGSPELLVIGAFKIASRELSRGNKKGGWLMAACVVLLLLTALTVGDLFVWHWNTAMVQILMGARCLAGIAYTFTRGVVTDDGELDVSQGSPVHILLAQFTTSIQETINLASQQTLAEVRRLIQEANQQQQQQIAALVNALGQETRDFVAAAVEELGQQNRALLGEAVGQLERANSRRLEAVYTKLEQVTVTLESNPSLPAVSALAPRTQFRRPLGQSSLPVRVSEVPLNGQPSDNGDADGVDWRQVIADKLPLMPSASSQQMSDAVGCSRSTAGKWLKILREEGVPVHAGN